MTDVRDRKSEASRRTGLNALLSSLCFVAGLPFALCDSVRAQQQTKVSRIGFLGATSSSANLDRVKAFRQGLREAGYIEGQNILIEYRYAEEKFDRLPGLAAELVALKVDVIVTGGSSVTRSRQASNG